MRSIYSLLVCCLMSISVFSQTGLNTEGLKVAPLQSNWPTPEALSFLDNEISNYNIFCAGEFHRSEMALEQKKGFISYLKESKGLDMLVIEFTYAYGYWVNKYLETGDTTLLRTITDKAWSFDKFKKNLPISHDSYGFFKWLYSFNQRYEKGVKVVAIDLDEMHHASLELWSVKQFLLKDSLFVLFSGSYPILNKLEKETKPSIGKVEKWKSAFKTELLGNESKVVKVLGTEYKEFKKILIGIDDVIERYSLAKGLSSNGPRRGKQRENVFIRNFKREIKPTDIVYVQFGSSHLFLNSNHDVLMTVMEKDPKYTGRILNIYVHCERCELGKSRTAYKPRVLFNDTTRGYWWHDWLGDFTKEEHDELVGFLNNRNSVVDLRGSQDRFKELLDLYQFLVVLF